MRHHSPRALLLAVVASLLLSLPQPAPAQQLSCENCRGGNLQCVSDPTLQKITDEECAGCLKSGAHWTWPCSVEGLCWCWDSTKPRFKPPPPSTYDEAEASPCDVFTEDMFDVIAPNAVHPYTYAGLCDVIDEINSRYDEKVFKMGSLEQQKAEWAAFVGHTTHESAQYTAAREALQCARTFDMAQGTFCKPCANENFDWSNRVCQVSLVANGQFYEEYCDKIVTPPHGCVCGPTTEVDGEDLKGLINPNFAYFGRGAIQLSWNANYMKASQVLAESADVLCSQPDLVATDPKYAWGTALWFWLFNKNPEVETTCHMQSLDGSFGGSLRIINGGLECPPDPNGYHAEAIVTRLRYYCIAASVIGVQRLLDFDGCEGLSEAFEKCVLVCFVYARVSSVRGALIIHRDISRHCTHRQSFCPTIIYYPPR
jgi:predicted chitinase